MPVASQRCEAEAALDSSFSMHVRLRAWWGSSLAVGATITPNSAVLVQIRRTSPSSLGDRQACQGGTWRARQGAAFARNLAGRPDDQRSVRSYAARQQRPLDVAVGERVPGVSCRRLL